MTRYPRLIVLFPGIMVIAKSEREYSALKRQDLIGACVFVVSLAVMAGWLAYQIWKH
jgi:hypothetical protein